MLSKKLRNMYAKNIILFIIIEAIIIFAYVYAIIYLTFSFIIILVYIVALLGSILFFVFQMAKISRFLYNKKLKVKMLKRPMEVPPLPVMFGGFSVRGRYSPPYFLLKQNEQGQWMYHDELEPVDQYQTFEMVAYNRMYALIKDYDGHYYMTYLDDLELVKDHV